jgi:protein-disulfide isomerase
MKQKTLFILSAVILLLVFVVGTLLYTSDKQEQVTGAVALNQANLLRMHSPTQGSTEAKVLIVEFFDPACETCRDFYPFIKQLMAAHPDRVRLAMRYTPFHEGSDHAVKVLEAARRQGKYWETLEALYAAQETWVIHHRVEPERMWDALAGVGLDMERVRQDMNAPEITALIAQDMADAETLKITKTPEFFVNGRPMPSFGYEQLQTLVEEAVAENYRN